MKLFQQEQLNEAREFSKSGGQALHCHTFNFGHPLFERYPEIAHLFDQDKVRLIRTVRELGVRVIKVEHEGKPDQHIDLCGKPFDKAKRLALKSPHVDTAKDSDAGQLKLFE